MSETDVMPGKRHVHPLSNQELVFVGEYMTDFSAHRAALASGYSRGTARNAFMWLKVDGPKPHIAYAVRAAVRARCNKLRVTPDMVIQELARIGFGNMNNYVVLDEDNLPRFDLTTLNDDTAAAIKTLTIDEYKEGRGDSAREIKRIKIELHDKKAPLVKLGEYLGLFDKEAAAPPQDPGSENKTLGEGTLIQQFQINLLPRGTQIKQDGTIIDADVTMTSLPSKG